MAPWPRVYLGVSDEVVDALVQIEGAIRGRKFCTINGEPHVLVWARVSVDGVRFEAQKPPVQVQLEEVA